MPNEKTVADFLKEAKDSLKDLATAKIDAELILSFVLKKDRSFLFAHDDYVLNQNERLHFHRLLNKRKKGYPVAYILKKQPFWTLDFYVDQNVLIPRPETEMLVEYILQEFSSAEKLKILDLGTGSGVIAVSLAKEKPNWQIWALDISLKALKIARKNARNNNVKNIKFVGGSWKNEKLFTNFFDVVVANPPYIRDDDPHLKDLSFEPIGALVSGKDGLDDIRIITKNAKTFLRKNGLLLFEHGFDQKTDVMNILKANGFKNVIDFPDVFGNDRLAAAHNCY